jgi:COP9 signalosome complex subunit 2
MSDDEEYEYEYGSDENYDYGSDNEEQDESAIEIENAFYEADDCKNENQQQALELFEKCVRRETEQGDEVKWRFKALEHIVTLQFNLGNLEAMAERYQEMLTYMSSVTRNECTDSINRFVTVAFRLDSRHINSPLLRATACWTPFPAPLTNKYSPRCMRSH